MKTYKEKLFNKLVRYGTDNPNATVEEISKIFKVDFNTAFLAVQDAGKKL